MRQAEEPGNLVRDFGCQFLAGIVVLVAPQRVIRCGQ